MPRHADLDAFTASRESATIETSWSLATISSSGCIDSIPAHAAVVALTADRGSLNIEAIWCLNGRQRIGDHRGLKSN